MQRGYRFVLAAPIGRKRVDFGFSWLQHN